KKWAPVSRGDYPEHILSARLSSPIASNRYRVSGLNGLAASGEATGVDKSSGPVAMAIVRPSGDQSNDPYQPCGASGHARPLATLTITSRSPPGLVDVTIGTMSQRPSGDHAETPAAKKPSKSSLSWPLSVLSTKNLRCK